MAKRMLFDDDLPFEDFVDEGHNENEMKETKETMEMDEEERDELIRQGKLNPLGKETDAMNGEDAEFIENFEDKRDWVDDVYPLTYLKRLKTNGLESEEKE